MTRFSAALAGLGAILFGFWFAWRLWPPLSVLLFVGVLSTDSIAAGLVLIAALSIPTLFFAQLGIMSILLALFAWQRRRPALTA